MYYQIATMPSLFLLGEYGMKISYKATHKTAEHNLGLGPGHEH